MRLKRTFCSKRLVSARSSGVSGGVGFERNTDFIMLFFSTGAGAARKLQSGNLGFDAGEMEACHAH